MKRRRQTGLHWWGFTLIELLVVVAILAILMGLAGNMVSQSSAKRWRAKRVIMQVIEMRQAYEGLSGFCGGPVYSNRSGAAETHFKDILCNNQASTGMKRWSDNAACTRTPAKGIQDFLRENIVDMSDTSCDPGDAFVEGNTLDQVFNIEESGCTTPASCPVGNGTRCPWVSTQGFLVATNNARPAKGSSNTSDKAQLLNPPWAVFCGAASIGPTERVLVIMDRFGTGTIDAGGNALTNPCLNGPWCQGDINGVAQTPGCCSAVGYSY